LTFGGGKSSGKEVVSITNDVTKEMIAGIINKCAENEQINEDSKIIISNVLPSVNFHSDTYSPEKKKCHLWYIIIPKLKNVLAIKKSCERNRSYPANQHHEMPLPSLKHLMV
jgi:hypothetical protein